MKMIKLHFLCALLIAACSLYSYDSAESALSAGKNLWKSKKYDEAVAAYCEAAKFSAKNGEKSEALFSAGKIQQERWKIDEAVGLFLQVAENPTYTKSQRAQGYLNAAKAVRKNEEKRDLLQKGKALESGDYIEAACIVSLGELDLQEKKYDEALNAFNTVAKQSKYHAISRAGAYDALARALIAKNEFAATHEVYEKLRKLASESKRPQIAADADFNEALLYIKENNNAKAAEFLTRVAESKSSPYLKIKSLENLTELRYYKMNDPKGALAAIGRFDEFKLKKSPKALRLEKDIRDALGLDD